MRSALLLPALLAFIPLHLPAIAQTAPAAQPGDLAAEQCIDFRRSGETEFTLYNSCDGAVNMAVCAEDGGASACQQPVNFALQQAAAGGDFPGVYRSLQSLSIFACRAPAVVRFEGMGQARCEGGDAVLPLLLASSLKNPAAIITAADYPRNVRAEGTTRFEMVVTAEGRPRSCTVTSSSGKTALDTATCNAFMRRARFSPAKDSGGQPVEGRYRGSVTWKEP